MKARSKMREKTENSVFGKGVQEGDMVNIKALS